MPKSMMTKENVQSKSSLQGIYRESQKQDSLPGPGHYHMDVSHQIKILSDKVAPRYKHNPFGSSISRFIDPIAKANNSSKHHVEAVVTEDELRVQELIKDVELHTGVTKDFRPGVRTAKLMH